MEKVPDAKTLVRLGQVIGPETIAELHNRIVVLAQKRGVIRGRKMRVDTTVVESNIHYPTDSGLLNDGARLLTRTMKKIEQRAGGLRRKVRNRMRSVAKRVIAIGQAFRHKGTEGEGKRKKEYRQLLRLEYFIVDDDLVLCFLQLDQLAKLVRLSRLSLADDLRVRFKQTDQFVRKLG